MADMSESRQSRRKDYVTNPGLNQIAEYLEEHASILQFSGYTKDAMNLKRWAEELRRRSSEIIAKEQQKAD